MKIVFVLPIVLFLVACEQKQQTATAEVQETAATTITLTDAQVKSAGITTGKPTLRSMYTSVRANGTIMVPPQNIVSVSFPMGGHVKSTTLLPGAAVSRGQVIAVLEDPAFINLQQDYLVARSRMAFLSADVQRQRELNKQEAVSEKQYQQVLAEFSAQQVLIRSLGEKLRLIGINPATLTLNSFSRSIAVRSPINGFVSRINVNKGMYVNPSDILFELVNPSDMYASINVFEKDIASFRKGLTGSVMLSNEPGKKYPVEVMLVTRNIDDSRTVIVHCRIKNRDPNILPGMYVVADFNLTSIQVFAVPEEAVVRYAGKHYIFRRIGSRKYDMVEVATGKSADGYTELLEEPASKWSEQVLVYTGAYSLLGNLKNRLDE